MSVDSVKQKNISKTLTLWNFFTIGFGAIIGTGWIFLVGEWIIISGGPIPAMLAFLLGGAAFTAYRSCIRRAYKRSAY